MKKILILPVLLGLSGCVTTVYDKSQEGQTSMDGLTCKNGVCNKASDGTFKYWTKNGQKDAAPEPVPNNKPPTPESTLPIH